MEGVTSAFLAAGLPGAVALVALAFGYLVFREWLADRAAAEKTRGELMGQVIAAHSARADDAKAALFQAAQALTASAQAGQAQANALAEVREALRSLSERR